VETITSLQQQMPDLTRNMLKRLKDAKLISEWGYTKVPNVPGRVADLTEKHVAEIRLRYKQYREGMTIRDMIEAERGIHKQDLKPARRSRIKLAAQWHTLHYGRSVLEATVCEAFAACGILIGRQTDSAIREHRENYAATLTQHGGRRSGDPVQIADADAIRLFFSVWLPKTQETAAKALRMSFSEERQGLDKAFNTERDHLAKVAEQLLKKAEARFYIEVV
jgi:hypothetical protein